MYSNVPTTLAELGEHRLSVQPLSHRLRNAEVDHLGTGVWSYSATRMFVGLRSPVDDPFLMACWTLWQPE